MAPFGIGDRKDQPRVSRDVSGTPVGSVRTMRSQGLSNNQIIQNLQRDGYQTKQIVDAMNQSDMQPASAMPGSIPDDMREPQPVMPSPAPFPVQQQEPYSEEPDDASVDERIEEIAEAIIDEKWNELVKQVQKIVEWKKEMESRIQTTEARFEDLKASFDALQQGVVQKVQDYDKNITSVGTDIKAMEKVFQKVLPDLTDNVNELSRITKGMRKK